MYRGKDVRDKGTASERREGTLPRARGNHAGCMNGEAGHAYSNGIAKVDIQGVLEFVRGREDFVELVRRHMGDDCAQLVGELTQEVKAAEGNAFYEGFCLCYQRIERVLAGDEKIAGTLREVMRQAEREYRWGDAWDDSFAVERMAERYQKIIEDMQWQHQLEITWLEDVSAHQAEQVREKQRNHQAEITRLESVIAHQAEQVKEMAVYKARAEAAEGAATDLCGDFVDFVCEGVGGNAAEYCANRSAECVDAYGECDMGSRFCKGFFPEAAREWTKRSIQEE